MREALLRAVASAVVLRAVASAGSEDSLSPQKRHVVPFSVTWQKVVRSRSPQETFPRD